MSALPPRLAPRALEQVEGGGLGAWLRRAFGRFVPRAEVIAAPEVRLGEELTIRWRLDYGAREVTNVSVVLVGREVARQRISARTGISVVTETRRFLTLGVDRRRPEDGAGIAEGRGTVVVPAASVPTVGGALNEISWVIVLEAAYQAEAIWTGTFAVTVLPAGAA